MSSFSTEDEQRIVEGSRAFFESLVKKDFANVEDFLSPDCRLQDQFGEGRGVSGSDQCMDKIREVAGKLAGAGLTKMESVCVMRNKRQVRFMLHGKVGFMKIAIGFAIEWSCGIISMLVIVRNAVDGEFLEDNTEAPQLEVSPELPTEAVAQHVVPHDESHISAAVADCAHELTDFSITADATATTGPLGVHKDGAAGQAKSEKWFPGKYIQQHRASSNPAVQKIPNPYWAASRPADYNVVMQSVGVNLQPPYLVPRPPAVSAALTVTVESASQLKSRLVRIVTRPVNSYVSVTVAGRSRNTPVVSKSSYPDYGAASPNGENIFIFELPNSVEFRRNGCIEFTIKDKNFRDEDILAEIVLPIISLKCKTDHTAPTALQLPVEHFSKHITRLGKGFKKRRSESHDSHKGEEIAYLNVSISKVDIMLWWVLEEIQARDEAREKIITEEKARKAMEAERKLAEEKKGEKRSKNNKKKCADPEKLTAVIFKEECDWIDGEYCYGCKSKFSLTMWKHHCRACAQVFCDTCSEFQIADSSGDMQRVCVSCHDIYTRNYSIAAENGSILGAVIPHPAASLSAPAVHQNRTPDSDDEDLTGERISSSSCRRPSADAFRKSTVSETSTDHMDEGEEMACVIS